MLQRSSIILFVSTLILLGLGIIMLASTSAWVPGIENTSMFVIKQAKAIGTGFVCAAIAVFFPLELIRKWTGALLVFACVLLILCYVPGVSQEIYGSKRWINLGFTFQPSEFAKVVTVVALAAYFARFQSEVSTLFRGFIVPSVMILIPIGLIAGETDVGTALTLSLTVAAMMFCVGTRLLFMVPSALVATAGLSYYLLNDPVRWSRIEAWLDLENPVHQLDKGMQQWRALLALGNGGPSGVGLGNGIEKFGRLTFAHIDFIFPVIGEELGLMGTLGVVICFLLIAVSGVAIALQAHTEFHRCCAIGLTCILVVPAIQNIGVTTALLPNDGLPLPFVSYGGTSIFFSMVAVGMLLGIHRQSLKRSLDCEEYVMPSPKKHPAIRL